MPIKFSPMEATLLSLFLGMVASLVTWAVTSSRCQTKACCDERHRAVCVKIDNETLERKAEIAELRAKQDRDNAQLKRMVAGLIQYNAEMTPDEKERLINDRRSV